MADAMPPTSDLSQQFSTGSIEKKGGISACRNLSFDIKLLFSSRFTVGRQSSLDLHCRSNCCLDELTVLENLDCTMQLLFLACHGDVHGVEELLQEGDDVNNIDLDGRTVLHIAACKEHLEVVRLLIRWRASIDARYRWGSMVKHSSVLKLLLLVLMVSSNNGDKKIPILVFGVESLVTIPLEE